jgi:hypothetical protein
VCGSHIFSRRHCTGRSAVQPNGALILTRTADPCQECGYFYEHPSPSGCGRRVRVVHRCSRALAPERIKPHSWAAAPIYGPPIGRQACVASLAVASARYSHLVHGSLRHRFVPSLPALLRAFLARRFDHLAGCDVTAGARNAMGEAAPSPAVVGLRPTSGDSRRVLAIARQLFAFGCQPRETVGTQLKSSPAISSTSATMLCRNLRSFTRMNALVSASPSVVARN